jgi:hypothetical protein
VQAEAVISIAIEAMHGSDAVGMERHVGLLRVRYRSKRASTRKRHANLHNDAIKSPARQAWEPIPWTRNIDFQKNLFRGNNIHAAESGAITHTSWFLMLNAKTCSQLIAK